MMEDILSGWMVGVVIYLLFLARDAYGVCKTQVAEKGAAMRSEQV